MPQLSPSPRRPPLSAQRAWERPVHVVVDWSDSLASSTAPARVELESHSQRDSKLEPRWICRQPSGSLDSNWEEALAAASCQEVVLTAELDDDDAKHLVFGLAEQLTLKLAATHPVVRVRFLPASRQRAHRAQSRTAR